jgi:hypothetical protein
MRLTLASALAGEMRALTDAAHGLMGTMDGLRKWVADGSKMHKLPAPATPVDRVWEKAVDRIGTLEGNLPYRVACFYGQMTAVRAGLAPLYDRFLGHAGFVLAGALIGIRDRLRLIEEHARPLVDDLKRGAAAGMFDRASRRARSRLRR